MMNIRTILLLSISLIILVMTPINAQVFIIKIYNPNNYDLREYQVKLNLTGYLDEPCYLKVVDSKGNVLPFTYERNVCVYTNNTISPVVWVKVPLIPAKGNITLYVYTSNRNYATTPDNVFIFYNSFDNLRKWVATRVYRIDKSVVHSGNSSLFKFTGCHYDGTVDLAYAVLDHPRNFSDGYCLEGWIYRVEVTPCPCDQIKLEDASFKGYGFAFCHYHDGGVDIDRQNPFPNWETINSTHPAKNIIKDWYHFQFITLPGGKFMLNLFDKNGSLICHLTANDTKFKKFDRIVIEGGYPYYIDDLVLRRYAEKEPEIKIFACKQPVVMFTYSPQSPIIGQTVTFDASRSYDPDGKIVKYEWDFGDGTTASGKIVKHVYYKAGNYTVTLTIIDNDGIISSTSRIIMIKGKKITLKFVCEEMGNYYPVAFLNVKLLLNNRTISKGITNLKGEVYFIINNYNISKYKIKLFNNIIINIPKNLLIHLEKYILFTKHPIAYFFNITFYKINNFNYSNISLCNVGYLFTNVNENITFRGNGCRIQLFLPRDGTYCISKIAYNYVAVPLGNLSIYPAATKNIFHLKIYLPPLNSQTSYSYPSHMDLPPKLCVHSETFNPIMDTYCFNNFATEISPGGTCAGMVMTAEFFFGYKHKYVFDDVKYKLPLPLDYLITYYNKEIYNININKIIKTIDNELLAMLLYQYYQNKIMNVVSIDKALNRLIKGQPVHIGIYKGSWWSRVGHALLAYGYIQQGNIIYFQVYDPNYPYEIRWLKYDKSTGKFKYENFEGKDIKFYIDRPLKYADVKGFLSGSIVTKELLKNFKIAMSSDNLSIYRVSRLIGNFNENGIFRTYADNIAGFMDYIKDSNGKITDTFYAVAYPKSEKDIIINTYPPKISDPDPLTIISFNPENTTGIMIEAGTNIIVNDTGSEYIIRAGGNVTITTFNQTGETYSISKTIIHGTNNITVHIFQNLTLIGIDENGDNIIDKKFKPPIPVFIYSPLNPAVNLTVTFDASRSYDPDGKIVKYEWDFGDGTTASGKIVKHVYYKAGNYTVTLTIIDNDGIISKKSIKISVSTPPIVDFSFTPSNPTVTVTIKFIDKSYDLDGRIISWYWNFGDGTTSTEQNPIHKYMKPGTYTITLTVTDNSGLTNSTSKQIVVRTQKVLTYGGGGGGYFIAQPIHLPARPIKSYITSKYLYNNKNVIIKLPSYISDITSVYKIVIKPETSGSADIMVGGINKLQNIMLPQYKVYKYFEIIIYNIFGNSINCTGVIYFRVNKIWVNKGGYDPNQIILLEYTNNNWKIAHTKFINKNGMYYYFRANVTSFGIFAICIKRNSTIKRSPQNTTIVTNIPSITRTPLPTIKPKVVQKQKTLKSSENTKTPCFDVINVISAVILILLSNNILIKKGRNKK